MVGIAILNCSKSFIIKFPNCLRLLMEAGVSFDLPYLLVGARPNPPPPSHGLWLRRCLGQAKGLLALCTGNMKGMVCPILRNWRVEIPCRGLGSMDLIIVFFWHPSKGRAEGPGSSTTPSPTSWRTPRLPPGKPAFGSPRSPTSVVCAMPRR